MTETAMTYTLIHAGLSYEVPVRDENPGYLCWLPQSETDYWIRCQQPERPGDDLAVYFGPCDACYLALTVDVRINPKPHWVAGLDELRGWRTGLGLSL